MGKLWSKSVILLGGLIVIGLMTSCSTALMKTSPFYTGSIIAGKTSSGQIVRWDDPKSVKIEKVFAHKLEAQMDNDRIYIWPIFYKNFLMYSILWPLAEINDVGWDIRPLISVDNYAEEYRILTGGWNNKQASNYIFPLYIKTKDKFISLPFSSVKDDQYSIYNFMLMGGYFSRDNSSYFAPLYYYNGTKGQLYSLICSFAKDNGYILPLYFYRSKEKAGKLTTQHHILPFGSFEYITENDKIEYDHAIFLPLFAYTRNLITDYVNNPKYKGKKFTYKNRPKDFQLKKSTVSKELWIAPTLFMSENKEKKQKNTVGFPFYFSGYDKYNGQDKEWLTIFPLFGYQHKLITDSVRNPKYQGEKIDYKNRPKDFWQEKQSVQKNAWIMPTVFINSNKIKAQQSTVVFPLYFAGSDKDDGWLTVFPLYFSGYGKDNVWRALFPLYFAGYNADETWMTLFPLCFSGSGKDQAWLTIFPFYFSGYNKVENREWFSIFPFYTATRSQKNSYKNYGVIAGTRDEEILNKSYHSSYIFPLYNYSYSELSKCRLNPIYKGQNIKYNKRPKDFWQQEKTVEKNSYYFPNIFTSSYENKKAESTAYFPFYFSGYEKMLDRDREWFAIFPFYTYNRDQQEITKNYGIFAGTNEQVINNKTYNSSYLIPFYNYGYKSVSNSEINPKYAKRKFKYNNYPKDYYIRKTTVAKNSYIFPTTFTEDYENNQYSNFVTLPFYFSGYDKRWSCDKEWQTIFPLYFYNRNKKDISNNYFGLCGTSEYEINQKMYNSSYLLPFYYSWYSPKSKSIINHKYRGRRIKYSRRPKDYYTIEKTVTKKSFIFPSIYSSHNSELKEDYFTFFPFISRESNKEFNKIGSFFSIYQRKEYIKSENLTTNLLWFFYYFNKTGDKTTEFIFPSYYAYEDKARNHKVNNLFPFIFHEKNARLDSWGSLFWFYTSRNYLSKGECETQALWYLYYNYQRTATKSADAYESSRVLWKVYHRETKGKNTNIDIFPFISYSQNSKRTKVSFAYRFFSINKSKTATKIHLLFIPIWW